MIHKMKSLRKKNLMQKVQAKESLEILKSYDKNPFYCLSRKIKLSTSHLLNFFFFFFFQKFKISKEKCGKSNFPVI